MNGFGIFYRKIWDFKKILHFKNFRQNFRKSTFLLTTCESLAVKYFAYQVKSIDILYKKTKCNSRNFFENCRLNLKKNRIFAYSFFVIDGKMMVGIAGGKRLAFSTYFLVLKLLFAFELLGRMIFWQLAILNYNW